MVYLGKESLVWSINDVAVGQSRSLTELNLMRNFTDFTKLIVDPKFSTLKD